MTLSKRIILRNKIYSLKLDQVIQTCVDFINDFTSFLRKSLSDEFKLCAFCRRYHKVLVHIKISSALL